jgi:hypothetical protein
MQGLRHLTLPFRLFGAQNIKETTLAYLAAVRKHIKSKYGKEQAAGITHKTADGVRGGGEALVSGSQRLTRLWVFVGVTVAAARIKVTGDVYKVCLKFGKNKFLCAVLRDLYLKDFIGQDIFSRKVGRKFVRENMKKIIKFTHHHIKHVRLSLSISSPSVDLKACVAHMHSRRSSLRST